jgi:hypothetical protein
LPICHVPSNVPSAASAAAANPAPQTRGAHFEILVRPDGAEVPL